MRKIIYATILLVLLLACTPETAIAPVDFCFVFDCSGEGWFDPCSDNLFADCP